MSKSSGGNPYDIDSPSFNSDLYLEKLLRECSLKQVMDEEYAIKRDAQTLHSDMQTLVYENYNKFISATDTIKKMKMDFKKMEDEMDLLVNKMSSVTSFSDKISSTLQGNRDQIEKLSSVDSLLKKLQFLFKLPNQLKAQIQEDNYEQAVQDYLRAEKVLEQYGHLESFQGIQQDCHDTLEQLKQTLRDQFKQKEATAKDLSQAVHLLVQLREPSSSLCSEYLTHAELRVSSHLESLAALDPAHVDILEFVQRSGDTCINDLCLMITCYNDMFINTDTEDNSVAISQLNSFVTTNMKCYLELVDSRLEGSAAADSSTPAPGPGDTGVLVRALDRFNRKVQTVSTLFAYEDFTTSSLDIIIKASRRQAKAHLSRLKIAFTESLTRLRHALISPKLSTLTGTSGGAAQGSQGADQNHLASELMALGVAIVEKVKAVLQDLMLFLQPEIGFASTAKGRTFLAHFCVDSVREGLVVSLLHHINATALEFSDQGTTAGNVNPTPLSLLLILTKMMQEYEKHHVANLLNITDEWFNIEELDRNKSSVTQASELCNTMKQTSQELVNSYVKAQGLVISQMLRKSVEAKDWLHGIEPRNVRAVMKRVIEELTQVDAQVGSLFEDGPRSTSRSSDSSQRTLGGISSLSRPPYPPRSTTGGTGSAWSNPHTLAISKLFSDRVDIFTVDVTLDRTSILTSIVSLSLKTLLECVRLKTFSRYGFQQVQVDLHYLQLYLWRFVSDENLIHFLLDEILGSAMNRCVDTGFWCKVSLLAPTRMPSK
uniref:Vacuolar protein sorting-associated protein 51 homolog n=1 Tax=Cacopsylla melanoneura TaxID=428564 RepID=A0A8D8WMA3_9HEMI